MPPSKMTVNKYTIWKVLIATALLTWLIKSGRLNFHPLLSTSFNIYHLMGIVLLFCSLFVQGVRWWWLLKTQKLHLPFLKTIHLSWIGQFFSLVLPGVAGGELARGYYITQEAGSNKVAGLSTVLVDRVMGLYALLCLSITSLVFLMLSQSQLSLPVLQFGILNVIMFSGISLLGVALLLHPTRSLTLRLVPGRYRTLVESTLKNYQIHMRDLLLCFSLSLLASIMALGSFQVAGLMVQTPLSWKQIFLVCPLVFIASTLPISPGGIGVGETAASLFFARFGVETGATIMLIVRIWLVILRLPGGLLYIVHTPRSPIEKPIKG
jgi:uncharacterized protein (TIRG00374 family)